MFLLETACGLAPIQITPMHIVITVPALRCRGSVLRIRTRGRSRCHEVSSGVPRNCQGGIIRLCDANWRRQRGASLRSQGCSSVVESLDVWQMMSVS